MFDSFFFNTVGKSALIFIVAAMFFLYSYRNSIKLFNWIEDQTLGTREYVLAKCELLFFEIDPEKVTYILLFLAFGISTLLAGLLLLMGSPILAVLMFAIFTFIGWKIPRPFMDYLVASRIKKYENQMVDALNLLSSGLRAGLSLPQAVGMIVEELPSPVNQEFRMILQQNRIGVPLEDCFENLLERIPTEDNQMFVTSVNILRETGGNLAEVFDTITNVIRERIRVKQKIDTFVAQGKFQGGVICAMPFALATIFGMSDPDMILPLFTSVPGFVVLLLILGLTVTGGWIMWKIIQIKV